MIEVAEGVERMIVEHNIEGNLCIESKSNLALSYQIRWDQRSSYGDLDRSVQLGYEIIDLLPADVDPDARLTALSNLAFRLQKAYPFAISLTRPCPYVRPLQTEKCS